MFFHYRSRWNAVCEWCAIQTYDMDITRVCDGLFLSDYESLTEENIRSRNISFVINATIEKDNLNFQNVEFMKLNIYDLPTEKIKKLLDVCADRIQKVRTDGGHSLVHCAVGVSRSVAICLAYLVKYENKTLRQAYYDLKSVRPIIRPNEGFWKQLISFEMDVCGKASVKMIMYPLGSMPDVYKNERSRAGRFKVRLCFVFCIGFCISLHIGRFKLANDT